MIKSWPLERWSAPPFTDGSALSGEAMLIFSTTNVDAEPSFFLKRIFGRKLFLLVQPYRQASTAATSSRS